MFDSPVLRQELLEGMVAQRLLLQFASRNYLTVDKEHLDEVTFVSGDGTERRVAFRVAEHRGVPAVRP